MGSHLMKLQLLGVAIAAWVASGVADRHHLPFAVVMMAVTAIVAGLLTFLPNR